MDLCFVKMRLLLVNGRRNNLILRTGGRKTVRRVVLFLAIFIFNPLQGAWSQAYRNEIQTPPVEVYQSMLSFVDKKDYAKVASSLKILTPIVAHIQAKYTDDPSLGIKKAIDKGNQDEILLSVQTLIVLDTKDLLDEALKQVEQTPDASRTLLKTARLNYELLTSFVQQKEFAIDQKIKKDFLDSYRLLDPESLYSNQKAAVDKEQIRRLWMEIMNDLTKAFPVRSS